VHRRVQKIHPCYPGLMRATQGGSARRLRSGHHGLIERMRLCTRPGLADGAAIVVAHSTCLAFSIRKTAGKLLIVAVRRILGRSRMRISIAPRSTFRLLIQTLIRCLSIASALISCAMIGFVLILRRNLRFWRAKRPCHSAVGWELDSSSAQPQFGGEHNALVGCGDVPHGDP
jgi:hypothetical protein